MRGWNGAKSPDEPPCASVRAAVPGARNAKELTQRLSGISDQEAHPLAKEIMEASNLFLGHTSNLGRVLSKHSPHLARWFLGFVAAVRQPITAVIGGSPDYSQTP